MKKIFVCLLFIFLFFSSSLLASQVWIVPVQGAIGPASSDYITRELRLADNQQVDLVILKMDTPGGLDSAMRDIIRAITSSPVAVATWVGPAGARAASAGTYILFASHFAVMANGTNLGAATPISITLQDSPTMPDKGAGEGDSEEKNNSVTATSTHEKKMINDASAYIKSLAKLHNRNALWAEKSVTEAASLDAQSALAENVIDFIADDLVQLIAAVQNKSVKLNGQLVTLPLTDAQLINREPDWRYSFLATLTNPNVAYILMLIGIYGLLLEFYNPGIGLPGVLGGICLFLGMYALQMLPVNYAGLALIFLGFSLLISEAFSPSFGVLGLGGIGSFVLGSVLLMDTQLPAFQIAKPLIAGFALSSALFTFVIITLLLKIRRKKVSTGITCMIGDKAIVSDDFIDSLGWVEVAGERWQARCEQSLSRDQVVLITNVSGLWLQVLPIEKQSSSS